MKHKDKNPFLSQSLKHKVPRSFVKHAEAAGSSAPQSKVAMDNLSEADQGLMSPFQPLNPRKAWGNRRELNKLKGTTYPPKSI